MSDGLRPDVTILVDSIRREDHKLEASVTVRLMS